MVPRVDERELAEVAAGPVAAHDLARVEDGLGLALDEEEHRIAGLPLRDDPFALRTEAQGARSEDRIHFCIGERV